MVLDLLLIGLAIALDPLPLSAFVVVLPSKRGVRKGAAFLFGWLVSLADGVDGDVTDWVCAELPPQPLSRRAAAAAVVTTSVCLNR